MGLTELFKKLEDHFNAMVLQNEGLRNDLQKLKEENARVRNHNMSLQAELNNVRAYHRKFLAINEESLNNLKNIDAAISGGKNASTEE